MTSKGNPFGVTDQDMAALQAIYDALMACNAADSQHLQWQDGTFGMVYDAFLDAATHLLGSEVTARRLRNMVLDGGTVAKCLAQLEKDYAVEATTTELLARIRRLCHYREQHGARARVENDPTVKAWHAAKVASIATEVAQLFTHLDTRVTFDGDRPSDWRY